MIELQNGENKQVMESDTKLAEMLYRSSDKEAQDLLDQQIIDGVIQDPTSALGSFYKDNQSAPLV